MAGAAITSSNITSPGAFSFAYWNQDTSTGTISVAGTASGGAPGDKVDIRCFRGQTPANSVVLRSAVVVSSGSFSALDIPIGTSAASVCRIRAVPASTTPADPSPFAGPGVAFDYESNEISAAGKTDYYKFFGQRSGSFDYDSANSCGLGDGYLNEPQQLFFSTSTFFCNQWFHDTPDNTKSTLQIDGVNAFAAYRARDLPASAGFQPLTVSHTVDLLSTGNATITESQVLMTCPNNVYPPTAVNCAAVAPLPVRFDRKITQDHDGLVSTIVDEYVSTDGKPHSLSVGYIQTFCFSVNICNAVSHQYSFPGQAPVTQPTAGTVINGPFPASSTIFASDPNAADGALTSGRAAITIFPAADNAVATNAREFNLNWNNRTVPATGPLRISASFAQAFTQTQLVALAADGARAITPQPSISAAKPSAKYDKKLKRVKLTTNQVVNCPADGASCAITAKIQTKVKLPAKKSKKGKKGKKKPKAKYKTYKFKALVVTGAPGSATVLKLVLPKSANALLKKYKKLTYTVTTSVTAGPYAATSATAKFSAKSPKFPKPKKKKKKKK